MNKMAIRPDEYQRLLDQMTMTIRQINGYVRPDVLDGPNVIRQNGYVERWVLTK